MHCSSYYEELLEAMSELGAFEKIDSPENMVHVLYSLALHEKYDS